MEFSAEQQRLIQSYIESINAKTPHHGGSTVGTVCFKACDRPPDYMEWMELRHALKELNVEIGEFSDYKKFAKCQNHSLSEGNNDYQTCFEVSGDQMHIVDAINEITQQKQRTTESSPPSPRALGVEVVAAERVAVAQLEL